MLLLSGCDAGPAGEASPPPYQAPVRAQATSEVEESGASDLDERIEGLRRALEATDDPEEAVEIERRLARLIESRRRQRADQ